jgi:cell division protein FtsL
MMKNVALILLAIAIPLVLFAGVAQTSRYTALETEVRNMENEQHEVITLNKRLVSGIAVLSTPERIERVATLDLGMKKAEPSQIMRIELKKGDLGG